MAKQLQGVAPEILASYDQQCAALKRDWLRLGSLIEEFSAPNADLDALEREFLTLRSTFACDYPILSYWRKGGYGLTAGINRMMAGAPALSGLVESAVSADNPTRQQWRAVWTSIEKIEGALEEARRELREGRPAVLPRELLQHDTHVPFPVRKILKTLAIATFVILAAGTAYFMRNFLGFWAPDAGSGLVVTEDMTDEERILVALAAMARAFRENDVDQLMAVVADDFRDEDGNSKTKLRVVLQAYKETGRFGSVTMDWSRMRVTPRDGLLDVRPVYINTPDERLTIHLGFKSYRGKLLIATGSST